MTHDSHALTCLLILLFSRGTLLATQPSCVPVRGVTRTRTGIAMFLNQRFTDVGLSVVGCAFWALLAPSCMVVENGSRLSALYLLTLSSGWVHALPKWALDPIKQTALLNAIPRSFLRAELTLIGRDVIIGLVFRTFLAGETRLAPERRVRWAESDLPTGTQTLAFSGCFVENLVVFAYFNGFAFLSLLIIVLVISA